MTTQTIQMPADTSIIELNVSPFLGGRNHNMQITVQTPAAGVMLQGNDLAGNTAPLTGDAGWYTLLTMTTTSAPKQETLVPRWIRRGAAGGTAPITLEGIQ